MTRFEVFPDSRGQWRFRMRASNGEIVLSSESYTKKANAYAGIKSIKANAHRAEVVELESTDDEFEPEPED